jgi:hypothetical protein
MAGPCWTHEWRRQREEDQEMAAHADDVLEDINSMNLRNWRNVAQDRERWKEVVEQAKTLNRL